jgi:hypothetical protein
VLTVAVDGEHATASAHTATIDAGRARRRTRASVGTSHAVCRDDFVRRWRP